MSNFLKKINKWLIATKILAFPRKIIGKIIKFIVSSKNGVVIYYNEPERSEILNLVRNIKKEIDVELLDNEAYQVFMATERTEKIMGDIAEVGVYKGGSAKIICEAKGDKSLYLFDTFEGLPVVGALDILFHEGQFKSSLEEVKSNLHKYKNVYFCKGLFPDSADQIKNKTFSFVHLDVDIYKSTLDCLYFFYPRMSKGGVIISHDYTVATGVKKAFDDFFKDKPEPIIELSGSQCLIVKV